MDTIKVNAQIIEDKSDSFVSKDLETIAYVKFMALVNGKSGILKGIKGVDVKPHVGKNVVLTLEPRQNQKLEFEFRVSAIEPRK